MTANKELVERRHRWNLRGLGAPVRPLGNFRLSTWNRWRWRCRACRRTRYTDKALPPKHHFRGYLFSKDGKPVAFMARSTRSISSGVGLG